MKAAILFILIISLSTIALVFYQHRKFNDGRLHVVFCNVGQGDAIFIRTPRGSEILYDGGPDKQVLSCLTNNMPFWDRTLELVLLSHPHADHLVGLLSVLRRYTVLSFDTEELKNETAMYTALTDLLKKQKTKTRYVLAGDRFRTPDGVTLNVVGPSKRYLQETSPGGTIGEKKEFASVIVHVQYGEFDLLLTGDSQAAGVQEALGGLGEIDVLQVPHHGSRTGLDHGIVDQLDPKVAVISVGKNTYGHPSEEILRILGYYDIRILRTDKEGSVEIVSDGRSFSIR